MHITGNFGKFEINGKTYPELSEKDDYHSAGGEFLSRLAGGSPLLVEDDDVVLLRLSLVSATFKRTSVTISG